MLFVMLLSSLLYRRKEIESNQRRETLFWLRRSQGCLELLAVRESVISLTKRAGWPSATRRTRQNPLPPRTPPPLLNQILLVLLNKPNNSFQQTVAITSS